MASASATTGPGLASGAGPGGAVIDAHAEPWAKGSPPTRSASDVVELFIGLLNAHDGARQLRVVLPFSSADKMANTLNRELSAAKVFPPMRLRNNLSAAPPAVSPAASGAGVGFAPAPADDAGSQFGLAIDFAVIAVPAEGLEVLFHVPAFQPSVEYPLALRNKSGKRDHGVKVRSDAHNVNMTIPEFVNRVRFMKHAELRDDLHIDNLGVVGSAEYATHIADCKALEEAASLMPARGKVPPAIGVEAMLIEFKEGESWPASDPKTFAREQLVKHLKDYAAVLLQASRAAGVAAHLALGVDDDGLMRGVPVHEPGRLPHAVNEALENFFPRLRADVAIRLVAVADADVNKDWLQSAAMATAADSSEKFGLVPDFFNRTQLRANGRLRAQFVEVQGGGTEVSGSSPGTATAAPTKVSTAAGGASDSGGAEEAKASSTDSESEVRLFVSSESATQVLKTVRNSMKHVKQAERNKVQLDVVGSASRITNYVIDVSLQLSSDAVFSSVYWRESDMDSFVATRLLGNRQLSPLELFSRVLAPVAPPRAAIGRVLVNNEVSALIVHNMAELPLRHDNQAVLVRIVQDAGVVQFELGQNGREPTLVDDPVVAVEEALKLCSDRPLVRAVFAVHEPDRDARTAATNVWAALPSKGRRVLDVPMLVTCEGVPGASAPASAAMGTELATCMRRSRTIDVIMFRQVELLKEAFLHPRSTESLTLASGDVVPDFMDSDAGASAGGGAALDVALDYASFWKYLCGRMDAGDPQMRAQLKQFSGAAVPRAQLDDLDRLVSQALAQRGCSIIQVCSLYGTTGATTLLRQLCLRRKGLWVEAAGPQDVGDSEWTDDVKRAARECSVICFRDIPGRRRKAVRSLLSQFNTAASPGEARVLVYLTKLSPPADVVTGSWFVVDPTLGEAEVTDMARLYNDVHRLARGCAKALFTFDPSKGAAIVEERPFTFMFPLCADAPGSGADVHDVVSVLKVVATIVETVRQPKIVNYINTVAASAILCPRDRLEFASPGELPQGLGRLLVVRAGSLGDATGTHWAFRHPLLALHVANAMASLDEHSRVHMFQQSTSAAGVYGIEFASHKFYKRILDHLMVAIAAQPGGAVSICKRILPSSASGHRPDWMQPAVRQGEDYYPAVMSALGRLDLALQAAAYGTDPDSDTKKAAVAQRVQLRALRCYLLRRGKKYDDALDQAEEAKRLAKGTTSELLARHVSVVASGYLVNGSRSVGQCAQEYRSLWTKNGDRRFREGLQRSARLAARAWRAKEWWGAECDDELTKIRDILGDAGSGGAALDSEEPVAPHLLVPKATVFRALGLPDPAAASGAAAGAGSGGGGGAASAAGGM